MFRWKPMLTAIWMLVLLAAGGCGAQQEAETVYLPEGDGWAAYLVADRDYGGSLLLLRRDALVEQLPFGEDDTAYYPESRIDRFLRTEFPARFPDWLPVCDTGIEVCRKFPDNSATETVTRSFFLLSATEAGIDLDIVTREGEPLRFFRDRSRQEVCSADGAAVGWWLRSTYTSDRGLAWHIGANGTLGGRPVWQPSGIRPALCLPADTVFVYREDLGGEALQEP